MVSQFSVFYFTLPKKKKEVNKCYKMPKELTNRGNNLLDIFNPIEDFGSLHN